MHKSWAIAVIAGSVLIGALLGIGLPRSSEASWSAWSCQYTISGYPVTGGTLSARGCASWWQGSPLQWAVWSDTYVPYSYSILSYAEGSDRCGASSWTTQMADYGFWFNSTYGNSPAPVGPFQNCGGSHDYKVYTCNWRKQYSSSPSQGTCGAVYY